jgi:hypothetical protein
MAAKFLLKIDSVIASKKQNFFVILKNTLKPRKLKMTTESLREKLILLVTEKLLEVAIEKNHPNITRQFDTINPVLVVDQILEKVSKNIEDKPQKFKLQIEKSLELTPTQAFEKIEKRYSEIKRSDKDSLESLYYFTGNMINHVRGGEQKVFRDFLVFEI